MKTDKNSRTPSTSGTDTHPEQAIPDSNQPSAYKNYSVRIYWARFDEGSYVVRAKSQAEALENALKIEAADLRDDHFNPIESVIQVASIKLIEEGQNDE